jgi:hypothetical protein
MPALAESAERGFAPGDYMMLARSSAPNLYGFVVVAMAIALRRREIAVLMIVVLDR